MEWVVGFVGVSALMRCSYETLEQESVQANETANAKVNECGGWVHR
jgi:hypothetical protein